jgi:hypothetical protein
MLVHKCDSCKKEIKGRDKEIIAKFDWLQFSFCGRCGKPIIEETQASSAQDDRVVARSQFCNRRPQLTRSLFSFTAFFEWTVAEADSLDHGV